MISTLGRRRLCWVLTAAFLSLIASYCAFSLDGTVLERDEHCYWQEFTFAQAQAEVRRHPDSAGAHAVMACHWEDKGRWNRAVTEWRDTLALDPSDNNVRAELAHALDPA